MRASLKLKSQNFRRRTPLTKSRNRNNSALSITKLDLNNDDFSSLFPEKLKGYLVKLNY